MRREVEIEDAEYGFTWHCVDGQYLLENDDGGFRRVNESVVDLLEKLARGELTIAGLRQQVEGGSAVVEESGTTAEEVLSLVETYLDRGVLREDAPVTRVVAPDDVRLWPRVVGFLALFAVFGSVVAPILGSVSPTFVSRISLFELAVVTVLSTALIGIHEYGHYAASDHYFDPSVRFDLVNGVVPAVVTDTTGSWMLPRNRRIWINLAGPSLELAVAVPIVALHYAFPDAIVVQVLLLGVFGHVFFSLNPLMHGDGYWILCDFFGLRNVRSDGIDDLTHGRLSLRAVYVVLSYGFGVVLTLSVVLTLLGLLGLADVPTSGVPSPRT